jgi:LPS O-antigen subunit length determinant protein (WzzB/FepE family)
MLDKEQSPRYQQREYSREIDILQLCADLWARRILIIACMLLATLCGLTYAYSAPERFKAEVRLYPANDVGLSKTVLLSPIVVHDDLLDNAFQLVQKNLILQSTFLELMSDPDVASILKLVFPELAHVERARAFSKKVSVVPPNSRQQREFITAKLEWNDSNDVVELANAWVRLAVEVSKNDLIASLNVEIKKIDQLIEVKKERAVVQLTNDIAQLKEAKKVADELEALDASNDILPSVSKHANISNLRALYLVGSNALDLEISALESRRNGADFYINDLSELKEKKAMLMGASLDKNLMSSVMREDLHVGGGDRVGPNRKLIVGLSLLFGLMLGLVSASIKIGFDNKILAK